MGQGNKREHMVDYLCVFIRASLWASIPQIYVVRGYDTQFFVGIAENNETVSACHI